MIMSNPGHTPERWENGTVPNIPSVPETPSNQKISTGSIEARPIRKEPDMNATDIPSVSNKQPLNMKKLMKLGLILIALVNYHFLCQWFIPLLQL